MTKPVVLNQRCKQLKRLLYARYGPTLPDDDAGREDLELVLGFTSDKRLASTITLLAPWMQGEAAGSLIDRVRSLPPDLRYLSPKKLGERVLLRHEERERHNLWQIEATDISNEVAAEMRKARRREALKRHRRNRGVRPRHEYLEEVKSEEPWKALSVSRATYFRRKAPETGCEISHEKKMRKKCGAASVIRRAKVRLGVKPAILSTGLQTQSHSEPARSAPGSNVIKLHFIVNTKRQPLNGYQGIATALSRINDAEPGMV